MSDVDMRRKRIVLTDTKNNETRTVPLVGHALDLMRKKVRRMILHSYLQVDSQIVRQHSVPLGMT